MIHSNHHYEDMPYFLLCYGGTLIDEAWGSCLHAEDVNINTASQLEGMREARRKALGTV